jgi:general secretion pathway protein D
LRGVASGVYILRWALPLFSVLALAACAYKVTLPPSEGHLSQESVAPPEEKDKILPPVTTSTYVPPPKPRAKVPTYSVVVNDVPVKELLLALARDTKENIDVHPGLQGLVSLNAIDETLPSILERISRQVNMRYRVEGKTIVVGPDTPYLKTYKVDYVNMVRETTSSISVSGQITSGSTGAAGGAAAPSGGTSSSAVNSTSKNNFWEVLHDNVQSILTSTRKLSQSADERQAQAEAARAAREERLAQAEAVARAGQGATTLFDKAFGPSGAAGILDVKQDIIINQVAGTVSVMATERQHQLVQQYLDSVGSASQRQVLIEATIAEVTLSKTYQAGVDWNRFTLTGGGFSFQQGLIGTVGATPQNPLGLIVGYANNPSNNIKATLQLLEQFGNTRVLSSPKLMALNNQTALLKVVDNIVYFTIQAQQSQTAQVGTLSTFTTTPNTVAIGVVLSLTPQVNDNGVVTLSVRPTITRVNGSIQDPNPALIVTVNGKQTTIKSEIPQVQVREMESVLQLVSGQTAILGGLMQDNVQRNTDQIPGLGNIPRVGEAFQYRNDNVQKTELVIFIRPVVVTNPSIDSDELKHLRKLLPNVDKTGQNP